METAKRIKVELTNSFHNSATTIILQPITSGRWAGYHRISYAVAQRARRDLCGISDCCCGGRFGERAGNQIHISADEWDNKDLIIDIQQSRIA